ncbi:hypothetical protein C8F04DRAFT_1306361 [Mycena alexandri]|uniref:RPN1 N-terminal domain-containing protein n=1 Tax=Mycena alexandri TaxID=1745969 RepID=A0AAD6SAH6_9AGAR|nr:hypothetical protein C8F04DRAFT_1306361 [Mycena alexandri]
MTYTDTQPRGTLRYRPGTWGHEYVRHLAAELGDEYTFRETEADAPIPAVILNSSARTLMRLETCASFLGLFFFLLFTRRQTNERQLVFLLVIEHPISKTAQIIVEACAFAGTGNVLKVQAMLHHCDEHINMKEKEPEKDETPAADGRRRGGEEAGDRSRTIHIGAEMSLRQFHHSCMHYGEPIIWKTVPLAIGLVSVSNPQLPILDTLSKYRHDTTGRRLNAIFAMGLVGVGTNNVCLAQMLRGLVHMGKGTIGLNPFFADRSIMSRPAVAGLLAVLTVFTDAKNFILDKYHWMLYFLVTTMYPRFLITVDKKLESMPVTALVVVGPAGKPRTISGF